MHRIKFLVLALLVACGSTPSRPATPPAAPKTQQSEPSVPVASIMNPSLTTDDTAKVIADVFAKNGIRFDMYGSLGFTISVAESQAVRARDLLRAIPKVTVIEATELAAIMAPPTPLAKQFAITRVELDTALAQVDVLIGDTRAQWNAGNGILLTQVGANTLFERMGLAAGDLIVRVDGTPTRTEADALHALALAKSQDRLPISISRKGVEMTVEIVATR